MADHDGVPAGASADAEPRCVAIECLQVGSGGRLRAIRLRALRDSPDAFGTTFEEAEALPGESWELQLKQSTTFVAAVSGRDVGLVRGRSHEGCRGAGHLISMWVAPEARRLGIGSALIDALAEWARGQGWDRLLLDVGESNTPALALYTRKGFAPTGATGAMPPPRDHQRELQMVMRL